MLNNSHCCSIDLQNSFHLANLFLNCERTETLEETIGEYLYDVEIWRGMKIDVNRSSNEYVTLTLKFATGETILTADRAYQVIETKTGYILKDADATNVVIEITKKGEMYYKNPNISVSGENGYVITFNGKRE